jgi:hypothetical protein
MTTHQRGAPTWIKAMTATGALMAALALLIAAVGLSSTSSTALLPEPGETQPIIPTTSTATTPTPTPPPGLLQAIATNTAPSPTPTPKPPKATEVPRPTCPATTDRDRICSVPTVPPTPAPTSPTTSSPSVYAVPTCDALTPIDACLMRATSDG